MKDYKKILKGVIDIINTTEKSDIGFTNICTYISENCPQLKESEDNTLKKTIKELSIEEKAKRYDEAIEKAKYYYDEGKTLEYANDIVSDIFSELNNELKSTNKYV